MDLLLRLLDGSDDQLNSSSFSTIFWYESDNGTPYIDWEDSSDQNDMITLNLSGGAIDTAQINYEEVANSFTISIEEYDEQTMNILRVVNSFD